MVIYRRYNFQVGKSTASKGSIAPDCLWGRTLQFLGHSDRE
jgi:hypothetical protein